MKPLYVVSLSDEAADTFRGLYHSRGKNSYFEVASLLIGEELARSPENERFQLAGKMSEMYRIKRDGIAVDYLVHGKRVRVICICLLADNPCDGLKVLNTLMRSGNSQELLKDLGLPEPLMRAIDLSSLPTLLPQ